MSEKPIPKAENTAAIFGHQHAAYAGDSRGTTGAHRSGTSERRNWVASAVLDVDDAKDCDMRWKYAASILTRASFEANPERIRDTVRIAVFDRSASSENPPSR